MNSLNRDMWEDKFDEKVFEIGRDTDYDKNGETKIYDFGYKEKTSDNWCYTIPDWGNIKKFIRTLLEEAKAEEKQRCLEILHTTQDQCSKADGLIDGITALHTAIQAISAITKTDKDK